MTSPRTQYQHVHAGCPGTFICTPLTEAGRNLPDRFITKQTSYGQRYYSNARTNKGLNTDLLIYISGSCTNHHLPPESTNREAIEKYIVGPTLLEETHCLVMDTPTNQRAILEATVRALERRFYMEGFTRIIFVSSDQYLVDGLLRNYVIWENQGWMVRGEERANKRYWRRIKNLCDLHRAAGTRIGVWEVTKEYLNSVNV